LDNVSSLSSDVQIVNSSGVRDSIWSLGDGPSVRSVFEGSSKLGGINSQNDFYILDKNRFVSDTLDDLLLVSVHSPDDITKYDPTPVIELWENSTARRLI